MLNIFKRNVPSTAFTADGCAAAAEAASYAASASASAAKASDNVIATAEKVVKSRGSAAFFNHHSTRYHLNTHIQCGAVIKTTATILATAATNPERVCPQKAACAANLIAIVAEMATFYTMGDELVDAKVAAAAESARYANVAAQAAKTAALNASAAHDSTAALAAAAPYIEEAKSAAAAAHTAAKIEVINLETKEEKAERYRKARKAYMARKARQAKTVRIGPNGEKRLIPPRPFTSVVAEKARNAAATIVNISRSMVARAKAAAKVSHAFTTGNAGNEQGGSIAANTMNACKVLFAIFRKK